MKVSGIKSKLLLAFVTVLVIITGLNVGLAVYLTNQQSEREAFTSLTRQTVLLQNELQETIIDLRAIAEKNVAGTSNLSDLATLYAQTQQLTTDPEQAAEYERGLLFNKIISLNRLQVVLQTADFSSAAVYVDNELSHYVTTTEAGMSTIRVDDKPLIKTGQNQAGELEFDNWPNWAEGAPSPLVTPHIALVNRPTISFDFASEQRVVLQIVIPIQAVTQTVPKQTVTEGYSGGVLVNDLSIATPETLNQNTPGQNKPAIIGAFVFKKVFDQAFLEEVAQKTGLLPALYSPDGNHQIQIVDLKMNPADLAQWARQGQAATEPYVQQRTLAVDQDSYYQTLMLWQFEEEPQLIIGFAQSAASTAQKVRETVTGLAGVASLVLLVGGAMGYLLFDRLVKPIRVLTAAVSRIGLSVRQEGPDQPVTPIASDKLVEINLRVSDEVGQLTTAFNAMIRQLRQSFETLEQRVAESTRDLRVAADVSKQITTVLDIDTLLQQVVVLTVQNFGLYAASVLLLQDDNQTLVNVTGADSSGQIYEPGAMPRELSIHTRPSLIARAARTLEAVCVNDVTQAPDFLHWSELSNTRSELAIPMRLGHQLMGIFDLQSERVDRFGEEDLRVLTTLADQIAIAVRNAQLFAASQSAKEKAELAQSAAEAANQAKSVFLANMSHELRTPLNAILGYADILKRRAGYTSPLTDGLNIIHQSGEHLLTLINDVLDLAKIEAGKLELNPAPFHLPTFLREIIGIIRARAEAKDLSLTYEALSPLPDTVLADEKRLRQVLLNLLGNAVKFTDQGHVTLRVMAKDEGGMQNAEYGTQTDEGTPEIHHSSFILLHFEVEDSGIGISPDQLERIFQPFEQVSEASKRAEGTGLGLAISQQIVQLMGGQLQVESSPFSSPPLAGGTEGGQGSTFWFEVALPLTEPIEQERPPDPHEIIGYEGARRRVLVADDKPYNRALLVDMLEPLGFEVDVAEDGQGAVDKALEWQPDVILMDLVMPVKTGIEATQEIRQRTVLDEVFIVAVSASVLETVREKSLMAGCDAFLPKPIKLERLLGLLATHLGLAWIYAEPEIESEAPLVPPPAQELAVLYDLAKRGQIMALQEQAVRLEGIGDSYLPFARKLQALARSFEIEQIKTFVEQFIKEA